MPLQPEPSAHAPWTSTIFFTGAPCAWIVLAVLSAASTTRTVIATNKAGCLNIDAALLRRKFAFFFFGPTLCRLFHSCATAAVSARPRPYVGNWIQDSYKHSVVADIVIWRSSPFTCPHPMGMPAHAGFRESNRQFGPTGRR